MTRTSATHLAPQVGGILLTQRHRGACTEQTAGLFFDDGRPAGRGIKARHEAAKAICRLCPILDACRAYARADPGLEGIWGGETQDERRSARRRAFGAGCRQAATRRAVGWPAGRPSAPAATAWTSPPGPCRSRPPRCGACSTCTASTSPQAQPIQVQLPKEVNTHGHHCGGHQ
jgi:WhiB family redox-sensing transcriptional regulator